MQVEVRRCLSRRFPACHTRNLVSTLLAAGAGHNGHSYQMACAYRRGSLCRVKGAAAAVADFSRLHSRLRCYRFHCHQPFPAPASTPQPAAPSQVSSTPTSSFVAHESAAAPRRRLCHFSRLSGKYDDILLAHQCRFSGTCF